MLALGALWRQNLENKSRYALSTGGNFPFHHWHHSSSGQVLAMSVGQACKLFLVNLLLEETIISSLKLIWACAWPQEII